MTKSKPIKMDWKVNTPQLIKEVLENPTAQVLRAPMQIFAGILAEVATRASQLNDDELNALMCRLALYAISDPYNPDFDQERTSEIIHKPTTNEG